MLDSNLSLLVATVRQAESLFCKLKHTGRALWPLCACVTLAVSTVRADHYSEHVKPLLTDKCIACHGPLRSESGLRLDAAVFIRKGADDQPVVIDGKPDESLLLQRMRAVDIAERMPPEGEGVALTKDELAVIEKWIADGLKAPEDEPYVASPTEHWAYQPIVAPPISAAPKTDASQADRELAYHANSASDLNAIDRLLSDLQRERGIDRVGIADRETWLRRVSLDLNGLPPTLDEIQAFIADRKPDAYDRVVERLLMRPAYGERWGRHWMDVWRYSDWDGYKQELRGSQRHIWHWRDWIIESLNAGKPYDQMIVEMLAGDEIAPTDPDTLRATGFLARNYHKSNRNIWLDATVEHTAKAFLGVTVACARCHDHKFDPISQDQYYEFRAIFEPHNVRTEATAGEPDLNKAGIPRVYDAQPDAETFLLIRGNEKQPRKDVPMAPGAPVDLGIPFECAPVSLPLVAHHPALAPAAEAAAMEAAWQRLDQARQAAEPKLDELRKLARDTAARGLVNSAPAHDATDASSLEDQLDPLEETLLDVHAAEAALLALRARYAADHAKVNKLSDEALKPLVRQAAISERQSNLLAAKAALRAAIRNLADVRAQAKEAQDAAAEESTAKPTGNPAKKPAGKAAKQPAGKAAKAKADPVAAAQKNVDTRREALAKAIEASKAEPTDYTPVGPVYPSESTGRRLALARWITDPRNPLTARVAVNQIWLRHFGAPLVDDVADFGLRAKQPATAALLDWLANELLLSGWDMKHLHRQIVLSQTYRLSSDTNCPNGERSKAVDPENRLFARANIRRLDAEEIRDSLLAAADTLDRTVSGPDLSEDDGEKIPRRSVYFRHAYEKQVAMLVLFDGASPNECYRRSPSILPQQALALANSQLSRDLSRRLGTRLHELSEQRSEADHQFFIVQLFQTTLCRQPSRQEQETCVQFLAEVGSDETLLQRRQSLAHALLNHNDFVVAR